MNFNRAIFLQDSSNFHDESLKLYFIIQYMLCYILYTLYIIIYLFPLYMSRTCLSPIHLHHWSISVIYQCLRVD